jgi:hypothetical protein
MSNSTPPGESLHATASELLEGYVLEALEPAEAALVDQHLDEGCEDCEEDVNVLTRVALALPLASRLVAPAEELKSRVIAAVGGSETASDDAPDRRPRRRLSILSRRFHSLAASLRPRRRP